MKKQLLFTVFAVVFTSFLSLAQTTLSCGGNFVDNGGATSNYLDNSDVTYTITPTVP